MRWPAPPFESGSYTSEPLQQHLCKALCKTMRVRRNCQLHVRRIGESTHLAKRRTLHQLASAWPTLQPQAPCVCRACHTQPWCWKESFQEQAWLRLVMSTALALGAKLWHAKQQRVPRILQSYRNCISALPNQFHTCPPSPSKLSTRSNHLTVRG